MEKQITIANEVSFSGIGLHTGNDCTITFKPAPANHGYKFVRTDLPEQVVIPALTEYVVDLSRGTTLGIGDVRVHTVEHVLAALAGLRIDNCLIELSANEPPVVDGSSMPYVEVLQKAGSVELDAEREYFVIDDTIRYSNDEKQVEIVVLPTDDYRITVMIDYFNPALGSQHTGLFNLDKEFVTEFAPARTFCFLNEVEALYNNDLIKGGSLESAIVIVDTDLSEEKQEWIKKVFKLDEVQADVNGGILNNTPLRYKNEPARHKLLDMIGDLTLVGVPIKGQVLAARPGHASNYELAKLIRKRYLEQKKLNRLNPSKSKGVVLDIQGLLEIMPHRYPFLLIDRLIEFDRENQTVIGYKNVTVNEPFFPGHFPGRPVMPGVLICEAMAQTGGLLVWQDIQNHGEKLLLFMGMRNVKFKVPVVPGDQLVMEVKLLSKKMGMYMFKGTAYVNGKVVAEAELQAAMVDR